MTETTPPALHGNDGLLGLHNAEGESGAETVPDTVVDVDLPLLGGNATGLGVVHGVDASGQVELSGGLLVSGNTDDGALGSELGQQSSGDTTVSLVGQSIRRLTRWRGQQWHRRPAR